MIVHCTGKAAKSIPCPSIVTKRESTRHREASSSFRAAQILRQGPLNPILRANLFPKVTDLACRLPLPALFCGPEAANLGDLMRLWVRSGVQINLSFGFSRAVGSASDTSNDKVLYQPIIPIARQSDFREKGFLKEKTTLPEATTCIAELLHVTVRYSRPGWRTLTPFPFKIRGKAYMCGTPLSFRIDLPMSICCSHETLLHFGLLSSHLNICYYHQDLHQELFYSGSRQELHNKPPCPPTHCCIV